MAQLPIWNTIAQVPALGASTLHVWLVEAPGWIEQLPRLRRILSADELERAGRFRMPEHQARSAITRGLTRLLLSNYLGVEPASLQFCLGPHGKPGLSEHTLQFNASHSGDIILLAFSPTAAVGIDVEQVRREMPRRDEIAEKHFAPGELAQLRALPEPDRPAAFFRCWSRKEAYIKMRGDGIFAGLQTFEVSLDPGSARIISPTTPHCWISGLPAIPGYEAAVCVAAPHVEIACYRCDSSLLAAWYGVPPSGGET